MPIKLLIADDERLFRQSLKILLETGTDIQVIADVGDGQDAVTSARSTEPDLALLDVDMPKMDGIKAARLIGALSPRTKILMLSVHHEEDKIDAALRAGALGYILKDTDRAEFIRILRQTHAGKTPSSPYLANLAIERNVNTKKNTHDRLAQFTDRYGLTELELKILRLVAEGLSNEEISDIIHLARETIKGHLKSLFRKLDVKNRTEAAVLAVREGLN
jgi:two-component system, NarL family, response regulator DegU